MDKDIFLASIMHIVNDFSYAPTLYALLYVENSYVIKRISIDETLENDIKNLSEEWIKNEIFSEDFKLKNIAFIDENEKIFYGIGNYSSNLTFPQINLPASGFFSENDQIYLIGLLVYINRDDDAFWLYQHKYKMTRMNRQLSLFAIWNNRDSYETLDKDIFKIDHKFDFVIKDDFLVTKNWKLLQQNFGFENYARAQAALYVDGIAQMGIISDTTKLSDCSQDFKFAKKLMKLKDSKVLQLSRDILLDRVFNHPHYSTMFTKDPSTGNIIVSTQKAVNNLLKMLNDSILHSELTGEDYESSNKSKLNPAT